MTDPYVKNAIEAFHHSLSGLEYTSMADLRGLTGKELVALREDVVRFAYLIDKVRQERSKTPKEE